MTFEEIKSVTPFKANLFIDWLNIKKNGGNGLNFGALFSLIRNVGGMIVRANIYLPDRNEGEIKFYDALKRYGFKLVIINERRGSANCDSKMAVDIVTQSLDVDVIYLLCNDADYLPAVEYLQTMGKRVLLIHVDGCSNDLRDAVDEWRHAGQLNLLQ